ncbi:glucokinase [Shimia sp. SDUM112013]|uniref:glucokinase n=1 Tax=Shimia sp. SDUM112013 TaxID=3136160 RepID=UPI0032EB84BF
MRALLADIGGTHSRFALADGQGVRADTLMRLENAAFPDFRAALAHYIEGTNPAALTGACLAVAGPVESSGAQLTNRNWTVDRAALSEMLAVKRVALLNDLEAMALALPFVTPAPVTDGAAGLGMGWGLVVGIGTGANICAAAIGAQGVTHVMACEAGHASLPASVLRVLTPVMADAERMFPTIESLFSGRGLARLETLLHAPPADAAKAPKARCVFARALGAWARDLRYLYLPRAGLVFCGAVARIALETERGAFLDGFNAPVAPDAPAVACDAYLVTDDAAALWGCYAHLKVAGA